MIKLPRTLHIEGSRIPPGQVDPDAEQFIKLSGKLLTIEEKVDGTGVAIFLDNELNINIWHRGAPAIGKEFNILREWANIHHDNLFDLLGDRYIMFGEWMYNKHTIFYDKLPYYFLESDMYDLEEKLWLSTTARKNLLLGKQFIKQVPVIKIFRPSKLTDLTELITKSSCQTNRWREILWTKCERLHLELDKVLNETDQSDLMEGLYIKHENQYEVLGRYKYVRFEFINNIINSRTHLRDRIPITNSLFGDL